VGLPIPRFGRGCPVELAAGSAGNDCLSQVLVEGRRRLPASRDGRAFGCATGVLAGVAHVIEAFSGLLTCYPALFLSFTALLSGASSSVGGDHGSRLDWGLDGPAPFQKGPPAPTVADVVLSRAGIYARSGRTGLRDRIWVNGPGGTSFSPAG